MDAMPYVDIIFGNETVRFFSLSLSASLMLLKGTFTTTQEATVFAQEQHFNTTDLKEIALKICQLPKQNEKRGRVAIITQGCNAVLLAENGVVTEVPVTKLDAASIVDTNGAGDAFVGGFLAQLVQKKDYIDCIKCGIWAATQIIQRSGCTFEGKPDYAG